MATTRNSGVWGRISAGLKEAQSMILNGQCAQSMAVSKAILSMLVGMQMDQACLVAGDLEDNIRELAEKNLISQQTREHYDTIRILGEQAEAGQNQSAQDANNAFYLLKEELEVYVDRNSRPARAERSQNRERSAEASAERTEERRPAQKKSSSGKKKRKTKPAGPQDLLKIAIPVLCVIVLIIIIKVLGGGKTDQVETTPVETTTQAETTTAETEESTTVEETTQPETEPETEAKAVYKTNTVANVRMEPNEGARIYTVLQSGREVEYKGTYDATWSVITVDGQDYYIATRLLDKQEPETTAAATTEAVETTEAETSAAATE